MTHTLNALFITTLFCITINASEHKAPSHIPGLEEECSIIDHIYKELGTLTRKGETVVYVNKKGVFENPPHQLNMYKFCYDVNQELTLEKRVVLSRYHAEKAFDEFGRAMQETPEQPRDLYEQRARQTGMVIETIACGLHPSQGPNVLPTIAAAYQHLEDKKHTS